MRKDAVLKMEIDGICHANLDFIQNKITHGDHTLIKLKTGKIIGLNPTSLFLLENCEGLTISQVVEDLYNQCLDKETLLKDQVVTECISAVEKLTEIGLIQISK